jgi:hypothetical protein
MDFFQHPQAILLIDLRSLRFAVPDESILRHSHLCRDVGPAKSLLTEFQSAVGIYVNGRPSEAHAASFGCFLPSYDSLADRAPVKFCDRSENCEDHFPGRSAGVDTLFQAYKVDA